MHDTGCLGLVHWDDPEGWLWGGRREEGSGWGTHVYLWWIHVDIWQNQYNIVKLKNKKKEYWSGLPFPPPGDLPDPGIEPITHVSCIGRQVFYH